MISARCRLLRAWCQVARSDPQKRSSEKRQPAADRRADKTKPSRPLPTDQRTAENGREPQSARRLRETALTAQSGICDPCDNGRTQPRMQSASGRLEQAMEPASEGDGPHGHARRRTGNDRPADDETKRNGIRAERVRRWRRTCCARVGGDERDTRRARANARRGRTDEAGKKSMSNEEQLRVAHCRRRAGHAH